MSIPFLPFFQRLVTRFRLALEIAPYAFQIALEREAMKKYSSESEIPEIVKWLLKKKPFSEQSPEVFTTPAEREAPNESEKGWLRFPQTAVSAFLKERGTPGLFGTVLITCQICVVGPKGSVKVVDLLYCSSLPLWLYLIAHPEAAPTDDILRDVYGYPGENEKTEQTEDPKARLLKRFSYHRRLLQNRINEACAEVGSPATKILLSEKRQGTTYWHLSDAIQIEDLALFETCRTLLGGLASCLPDEQTTHFETRAACERISEMGCNLPDWLNVQKKMRDPNQRSKRRFWTTAELTLESGTRQRLKVMQPNASWYEPWFCNLLKEALTTYSDALQYLAKEAHRMAVATSDEEARRRHWCREEYFWSAYALSCASQAGSFLEEQETLIIAGELALQKALSCSLLLCDPLFDAMDTYYHFKKKVDGWEPSGETVQLMHALEEKRQDDDLLYDFWGDRYSEARSILKRWNAES